MTTYEELLQKHGYIDLPKVGVNEDGEKVMITIDEDAAVIDTFQNNSWVRTNIYYKDGTVEELYGR